MNCLTTPSTGAMTGRPKSFLDGLQTKHDSYFVDEVMGAKEWSRHRTFTHRYGLHPGQLLRAMLGILPLLLCVALLSAAVGIYNVMLVERHHWPMISLSTTQMFFSSITFALTLMLVFRVNASYARWADARRAIGLLTSTAHNFVRAATATLKPQEHHLILALGRWTAASLWAVKALVRPASCLQDELQGVLMPHELDWLLAQHNKPLSVAQAQSTIVAASDLHPIDRHRLDSMITSYTFEFGACNRIYNTSIPSAFTRHTSRFLMVYILVGLPLLLWPLARWCSTALSVLISFLLLGVEHIAAHIEEPFHVLAFDAYCAAVQRDVHAIIGMCEAAAAGAPTAANIPVVGGLNSAAQPLEQPLAATATTAAASIKAPSDGTAAALQRACPAALPGTSQPVVVLRPQCDSPLPGLLPGLLQQPRIKRKSLERVHSRTCLLGV